MITVDRRPSPVRLSFDEILQLIRKQRVAMLTTVDHGAVVSRPVGMQEPEDDGTLWFFSLADSDIVRHVSADPRVSVALAHGEYVSISGRGEVVHDPELNRRLWNSVVRSWLQCGPDDPSAVLIKVTPESIAYWYTPGTEGQLVLMPDANPDSLHTLNTTGGDDGGHR